jgi:hypothetical protein
MAVRQIATAEVFGFVAGSPENSERTQQHRADEYERREHRQHIELQGKVHVRPPFVDRTKV